MHNAHVTKLSGRNNIAMSTRADDVFSPVLFFKLQPTVVTAEEQNEYKCQQTSCRNKIYDGI